MMLHVLGYGQHPQWETMAGYSDRICTALQLINHWQDVFVDHRKDRLYVPLEDMDRFGYSVQAWKDRAVNEPFRRLMAFQIDRTMAFFKDGRGLFSLLRPSDRRQIELMWWGGVRMAEKIRSVRYDVLHHRPRINALDKVRIAWNWLRH
jgi:phytoene/squalene synthetase